MTKAISRTVLVALGVSAFLFSTAHATLAASLSLEALTQQADHIAVVEVMSSNVRRDERHRIVTDHELHVLESIKGDSALVVTIFGGEVGDVGMRIEGEPTLVRGQRFLVFLRNFAGTTRPVGMSQGVLRVQGDRVQPGGAGLTLQNRGGQGEPPALTQEEDLAGVLARVRAYLRHGASQ